MLDYLHEVEHMTNRVLRLEQAIAEAVKLAPVWMQESGTKHCRRYASGKDFGGNPGQRVGRDLAFRYPRKRMGYSGRSWRGFQR